MLCLQPFSGSWLTKDPVQAAGKWPETFTNYLDSEYAKIEDKLIKTFDEA